ncbi:MAG: hypothetical protein AB7O68_06330 [Pirellulales bacterium]
MGATMIALVVLVLYVRVAHVVHNQMPAEPVQRRPLFTYASGLVVRLLPSACEQQNLKSTELAATILALTSEIEYMNFERSTRMQDSAKGLDYWERVPVVVDGKMVELRRLAQLARRFPPGGPNMMMDTILVDLDTSRFPEDRRAIMSTSRLIDDTAMLLNAVAQSRTATIGSSFVVTRDGRDLIVQLLPVAALSTRPSHHLGHSISAIEIELATRGWNTAAHGIAAEAYPPERQHLFGQWLQAVLLAESALEGSWGADNWSRFISRHIEPSILESLPVAADMSPSTEIVSSVASVPTQDVVSGEATLSTKVESDVQSDTSLVPARAENPAVDHVARVTSAVIGGTRPTWVNNPPEQRVDAQGVFRLVGATMQWATPQESQRMADEVVYDLFTQYVRRFYGDDAVGKLRLPHEINASKVVLWTEMQESATTGLPMYETHVMLSLDRRDRRVIEERLQSMEIDRRVHMASACAILVLGLIATLWGYLRLDTASRGYYSGRLKLGAAAVVSLVVGVALQVARW